MGRRHFETVAKGSKEFDNYLRKTLRGGDDEIAFRDQWRNDDYQKADVKRSSSVKPLPKASASRTAAPAVTDTENGSSDDSDTDTEDDEDGDTDPAPQGGAAHSDAGVDVDDDEISSADFKKFLKIQALIGKGKKKR